MQYTYSYSNKLYGDYNIILVIVVVCLLWFLSHNTNSWMLLNVDIYPPLHMNAGRFHIPVIPCQGYEANLESLHCDKGQLSPANFSSLAQGYWCTSEQCSKPLILVVSMGLFPWRYGDDMWIKLINDGCFMVWGILLPNILEIIITQ